MKTATKTVKVRLMQDAKIPNARWCEPVGWDPTNVVDGFEYDDGAWWDENDEDVISLMWFGEKDAYGHQEVIEASPSDLRVAFRHGCRVIAEVEL